MYAVISCLNMSTLEFQNALFFFYSSSNIIAKLICQEYNVFIKGRHFMERRMHLKKYTNNCTRSEAAGYLCSLMNIIMFSTSKGFF